MRKLRQRLAATSFLFFLILSGCGTFGLVPADNLGSQIAYAKGSLAAVYDGVANAYIYQEIGEDEAKEALKDADQVRDGLNAAEAAVRIGDVSTAEGRLLAAQAILNTLLKYTRGEPRGGP